MMTMRTRVLGLVTATGLACTPALAVPPALDHVSADTPVIIGIQSLSGLSASAQQWMGKLAPPEAMMGLTMVGQILETPGLNPAGSAAVALSFPNGMESEPVPTIILPVADYAAFVEAMQGQADDGVSAINFMDETLFVKSLGSGFMAVGPEMTLIEDFDGSKGRGKAHDARLGAQGAKASDQASIFVVVDVASMRPVLDEALAQMDQQMEMAAMMAGEAAAAQLATMASAAKAVVEDGRTAFLGLGASEDGLWLDFAGQFADGSDTGAIFSDAGDATPLFAALPNMDYIVAAAFDTSSPGIRSLMASAMELNKGMSFGLNTAEAVKYNDGSALVMGVTPGLFAGGLFANTVAFTASNDPAALLEVMKSSMVAMNDSAQEGILFHTTWQDDAAEVAGHSLHAWGLSMEGDPNHPNGAQAGMALQQMTMLFGGQAGPSGYAATTEHGLYATYAKSTKLMEQALNGGEDPLTNNESIKMVAGHLPAERTAEGYLNIKGVLDMVMPLIGMMGVAPDLGELPEHMNPIGMGLATGDGGMHARVFVPGDVLEFIGKISQEMNAGGDEWEEVEEEPDAKPRF